MQPIRDDHPLKQLFTGLVEHAFLTEVGLCDPALTDYVSDLLIDFVHVDEMRVARDVAGCPIGEIGEIIGRCELTDEPAPMRDRLLHRRIGDYTLFWTGVYPEGVRRAVGPSWRDQMADYVTFGKRSYAIASELTSPDDQPPPALLRCLSEEFETCVYGLGLVRVELNNPHSPEGRGGDLIY